MDSFAGMRKMQTLRKLPIAAPNIKAKMFKIMASSLLNFYIFFVITLWVTRCELPQGSAISSSSDKFKIASAAALPRNDFAS